MSSEEKHREDEHIRQYGVPRDLYASLKFYGFRMVTALTIICEPLAMITFTGNEKVFPRDQVVQFILFILLNFIMMCYLFIPFNGDKNNLHALKIGFTRRRKYQSIDKNLISQKNIKNKNKDNHAHRLSFHR